MASQESQSQKKEEVHWRTCEHLLLAHVSRFLESLIWGYCPVFSRERSLMLLLKFIDLFEEEAVKIERAQENAPNPGKVKWFLQG